MKSQATVLFTAVVVTTMFLAIAAPVQAGDMRAEQKTITELGKLWVAAVARKDVKAIVNFYTTDGVFLPQNGPMSVGRDAIGKAWTGLLQLPGISLTFKPTRIDVTKAGDMAADIGTYKLSFDGKQGRVQDRGKYVVVWKKVDGEWKALADIINTSMPAQ